MIMLSYWLSSRRVRKFQSDEIFEVIHRVKIGGVSTGKSEFEKHDQEHGSSFQG
jgi:hypothetical protein